MNEIYKGMDNAAEKINENFEALGFESGENENGTWTKFPDGTMICTFRGTIRVGDFGRIGWSFPKSFTEVLYVNAGTDYENRGSWDNHVITPRFSNLNHSSAQFTVGKRATTDYKDVPANGTDIEVTAIAIGRWK